ncbi:glycosyl transferase [Paractinoplanes deccanensis]|uniref:Glycosyl transferase n=1 Tax=Paractinoplanes deccanensis TaxID=113561 RepID=A0ABQ3YI80_9ACTN|nr:glycosyltransferase [Actinoplanes deccanensis]GID79708.1 glycosyl transferase [Actinoplanes deccanensis]
MRVLHVIGARPGSGAEHQLRLLLRRLPQDGEVVTLGPPAPVLRAIGAPLRELPTAGDRDFGAIGRLRRVIRDGRFDVVHTHLFRACVQGRAAARLAGMPRLVATEYHADEGSRTAVGVRALYLAGERYGGVTIAASAPVADRLRRWGVPGDRVVLIPKALDPAEFAYDPRLRAAARQRLRIPPGTPVIGAVGRLEPRRRFDSLIRAVAEVPGAILLLVGDGPAQVALQRLAAIEGVSDRVLFAGRVEHAREMLCAMDVFASPGRETSGLAVLEALAAGLPALYAACPPLEEMAAARTPVRDARRLTPHDPESLPRALRTEVLCHDERHGARLPARTLPERYRANRMAADVGELYERVAAS